MKVWIEEDTLTGIADAIRSKKGTNGLIPTPNMKDEILSISGGGEGHREVESIITDGACYINTYICPNPNYSIEMECRLNKIVDDRYDFLFGTRYGDNGRWQARFDVVTGSAPHQLRVQRSKTYGSSGDWYTSEQTKQDWMDGFKVFKLAKNEVYIDGVLKHTFGTSVGWEAHYPFPVYLFTCNDTSSESAIASGYGHFDCKYVKMWDEKNNLILDLIPVLKNDGTVCMYNKVNGAYYYNAGTGTFTYTE